MAVISDIVKWVYGKQFKVFTALLLRSQVLKDVMLYPWMSGFRHSFETRGTTHPMKQCHLRIPDSSVSVKIVYFS
jgi:hypothetical protein